MSTPSKSLFQTPAGGKRIIGTAPTREVADLKHRLAAAEQARDKAQSEVATKKQELSDMCNRAVEAETKLAQNRRDKAKEESEHDKQRHRTLLERAAAAERSHQKMLEEKEASLKRSQLRCHDLEKQATLAEQRCDAFQNDLATLKAMAEAHEQTGHDLRDQVARERADHEEAATALSSLKADLEALTVRHERSLAAEAALTATLAEEREVQRRKDAELCDAVAADNRRLSEIDRLQGDLRRVESARVAAEEETAKEKARAAALDDALKMTQRQLKDTEADGQRKAMVFEADVRERDRFENETQSLTARLERLVRDIDLSKEREAELKQRQDELRALLRDRESELSAANQAASSARVEMARLQEQVSAAGKENATLTRAVELAKSQNVSLTAANSESDSQTGMLRAQLQESEETIQSLRQVLSESKADARRDIEESAATTTQLHRDIAGMRAALSELTTKLEEEKSQSQLLTTQVESLRETKRRDAETAAVLLDRTTHEWEERHGALQCSHEETLVLFKQCQAQLEEAQGERDALQSSRQEMTTEGERLNRQLQEARAEQSTLRQELMTAKSETETATSTLQKTAASLEEERSLRVAEQAAQRATSEDLGRRIASAELEAGKSANLLAQGQKALEATLGRSDTADFLGAAAAVGEAVAALKRKVTDLEAEKTCISGEVSAVKTALLEAQQNGASISSELSSALEEIKKRDEHLATATATIQRLQAAEGDAANKSSALETAVRDCEAARSQLLSLEQQYSELVRDLAVEKANRIAESATLTAQNAASAAKAQDLESKAATMASELLTLQKHVVVAQTERQELEASLERESQAKGRLDSCLADCEKRVMHLERRLTDAEAEKDEAVRTAESVSKNLADFGQSHRDLTTDIDTLKSEHRHERKRHEDYRSAYSTVKAKLCESEENRKVEIARHRTRVQELRVDRDAIFDKFVEVRRMFEELDRNKFSPEQMKRFTTTFATVDSNRLSSAPHGLQTTAAPSLCSDASPDDRQSNILGSRQTNTASRPGGKREAEHRNDADSTGRRARSLPLC